MPSRTCIGCRTICSADGLIRLSAPGGQVAVAPGGSAGRGAWLHPRDECLRAAIKSRAFARAFRRAVTAPPPEELLAALTRRAGSQRE
jgi:uncharacterized protein